MRRTKNPKDPTILPQVPSVLRTDARKHEKADLPALIFHEIIESNRPRAGRTRWDGELDHGMFMSTSPVNSATEK